MSAHTPGPWIVEHGERPGMAWNRHIVRADDRNHRICFMTSNGRPSDADLIAAAPKMLAMLQIIEHEYGADHWEDRISLQMENVRKTIAEAKGKP